MRPIYYIVFTAFMAGMFYVAWSAIPESGNVFDSGSSMFCWGVALYMFFFQFGPAVILGRVRNQSACSQDDSDWLDARMTAGKTEGLTRLECIEAGVPSSLHLSDDDW